MKQLYYVIRTLLRGRGSNIIKVISLGLGLTMSILLFSRVAFEQSYDTCYEDYDNLYQIFSIFSADGEQFEPQKANCGPVAGAILENFLKRLNPPPVLLIFWVHLYIMALFVSMPKLCWPIRFSFVPWALRC